MRDPPPPVWTWTTECSPNKTSRRAGFFLRTKCLLVVNCCQLLVAANNGYEICIHFLHAFISIECMQEMKGFFESYVKQNNDYLSASPDAHLYLYSIDLCFILKKIMICIVTLNCHVLIYDLFLSTPSG